MISKPGLPFVVLWLFAGSASLAAAPTMVAQSAREVVAWWPGDGDATDVLGLSNGALVREESFAAGVVGPSFEFDGVQDYIRAPGSVPLNTGPVWAMTIEGWINPVAVESQQPIVEWNDAGRIGAHLWISVVEPNGTGSGCLYANVKDTLGGDHVISSPPALVQPGVFQHVALTYDSALGIAILYLNGEIVGQTNVGRALPFIAGDVFLGHRPPDPSGGVDFYFMGRMDEITLYSRVLTPAEILSVVEAGSAGKCRLLLVSPIQDQAIQVGEGARFEANVRGREPITYQWQRDGTDIPGATGRSLSLTDTTVSQVGRYSVIARNPDCSLTASAMLGFQFLEVQTYAGLTLTLPVGTNCRVEYTVEGVDAPWTTLTNLTLPTSPYTFIDMDSRGPVRRFYRAAILP